MQSVITTLRSPADDSLTGEIPIVDHPGIIPRNWKVRRVHCRSYTMIYRCNVANARALAPGHVYEPGKLLPEEMCLKPAVQFFIPGLIFGLPVKGGPLILCETHVVTDDVGIDVLGYTPATWEDFMVWEVMES